MLYLHDFSSLQLFYNDGGEHGDEVLYGTTDGKIGFVHLTRCEALERLFLCTDVQCSVKGRRGLKVVPMLGEFCSYFCLKLLPQLA